MQQLPPTGAPPPAAPRFYLTARQPLRPGVLLLATVAAGGALLSLVYAMSHSGRGRVGAGTYGAGSARDGADDEKDDPSQIDTIVLGDPSDAPVPGRKGDHVSPVHPTIVVRLPRFGDQVGLIPNTPVGKLLYQWLAAFNKGDEAALQQALPNVGGGAAAAAQMELRRRTGGFNLLSAKEVQPGVLVFRLLDQTASAGEALGTLQVDGGSNPAAVGSFSLRRVEVAGKAGGTSGPLVGARR